MLTEVTEMQWEFLFNCVKVFGCSCVHVRGLLNSQAIRGAEPETSFAIDQIPKH